MIGCNPVELAAPSVGGVLLSQEDGSTSGTLINESGADITPCPHLRDKFAAVWLEGVDVQPTRVSSSPEFEPLQVNSKMGAGGLALDTLESSLLIPWSSLWSQQTLVAGFSWDRGFRVQLGRRASTGLDQRWVALQLEQEAALLALQRTRVDKLAQTSIALHARRVSYGVLPIETGRAALDIERGSVVPVWSCILPLPHLDVDPTFVHAR